ncbi:membrane protein [Dissulfurispira thermophila]|uniref:Membrane protein n=2 Tax=root TaxID=1 RepID=A0A7G1GZJ3_9BACT|nr:TIGR00341 family protein [Dissulfurispira thermophila]BCB95429.1 membrane protein [Dissulfurispira thermophila]
MKKLLYLLRQWLEKQSSKVNHRDVIKDVYQEVHISPGYFVMLTLANLIALAGLLQNSVAVIIGAMLISPLMGPILSFGFAFVTGDKFIWKKSIKKISLGVALTIAIAGIASYFSPLKEVTGEILSRTRPNLYDLIIAFLAGTAGATAICTKRNYLTIVPGVAIATAVIPPLSVTGFGLGTGSWKILAGGFFLFFTNFVAIIMATGMIAYFYGFKPSAIFEEDIPAFRKRIVYLTIVLFVISIPLFYTLHKSIAEVRLRANIHNALKDVFDKPGQSHISSFNFYREKNDKLDVNVTLNTISYLKELDIVNAEKRIRDYLKSDIKLNVEQVKVQPGGLKEEIAPPPTPTISPPRPPQELIREAREKVISVVRQSTEKIDKLMSPSTIAEFHVGFHDKTLKVSISMKIKRDAPLSDEEILWLKRIFATDLNIPVDVSIETIPFVPLLVFQKGETELSEDMKNALAFLKDAYLKNPDIDILIVSYTGAPYRSAKRERAAQKRIEEVISVLKEHYGIPADNIKESIVRSKKSEAPAVKVTVAPRS